MPVRIAITMGDYNGIGPEIILKCLQGFEPKKVTLIILGSVKVLDYYNSRLNLPLDYRYTDDLSDLAGGNIHLLESTSDTDPEIDPGQLSLKAGKAAMQSVERGIELCMSGAADALVTAPISKEAVHEAGYAIPGHTEFLAEQTGTGDFMMMLVHDNLRVGLLTTHIPLREVASRVSIPAVDRSARIMNRSLKRNFGIASPRIAVLGLNPHAGDGGHIGSEEQELIAPALRAMQSDGIDAEGPFPADGFFGSRRYKKFDGILAMYHDQGLIPFKTLSFGAGVNFTAGLPFVRTSPDHGTAFDIAGTGQADPASFLKALELAIQLTSKRARKPA